LPNHTWVEDEDGIESIVSGCDFLVDRYRFKFPQAIEHDPSAGDWTRLRRYASWMRGLNLGPDGDIRASTFSRLSSNSPGGMLCPKLEWLHWDVRGTPNALTSFRLFLSPHLNRVNFNDTAIHDIPRAQLACIVQIISSLPTSLEDLTITCGREEDETLKDAISTFVCRCGPSLRRSYSKIPLSEVAIHHIMQLPNLRSWIAVQGPPQNFQLSVFPSLEVLYFLKQATLPWLHLLASHEANIPQNYSTPVTSHAKIGETLRHLNCLGGTTLNSTFVSLILKFRNLVRLHVTTFCGGDGSCNFHLTDDIVENLAAALPYLEGLQLGQPCSSNACNTTVASLLSISTHCLGLTLLETHFNTLTIVGDMQRLLDGGSWRDKGKCGLRKLVVGFLPVEVGKEDTETVVEGFKVIFPCLDGITNYGGHHGGHWDKLVERIEMWNWQRCHQESWDESGRRR